MQNSLNCFNFGRKYMNFTEKFLYHIWDAQHLTEKLKTAAGSKVEVIYPGIWNTDSGPDFKNAILKIDGEIKRGDVELEISSYNWHLHEHAENPAFNSVILHVVYDHNSKYDFTIAENGSHIEILEIKDKLSDDIEKLLRKYSQPNFTETTRLCSFFAAPQLSGLAAALEALGMKRFESKVKRFQAEHYFADYDQMLWQGIMEALGYSKNKFQMLQMALYLKMSRLKEFYTEHRQEDELIALLLGTAKLLDKLPSTFPPEFKLKWQSLFAVLEHDAKRPEFNWNLFRIRPVNHPAIRIVQFSRIIHAGLASSLFHNLLKLFSVSTEKFTIGSFRKNLYDYFQINADFLPDHLKMGKTRIDTILINIILPLMMVYAREKNYRDLAAGLLEIYRAYPCLPTNSISIHMERFMDEKQIKLFRSKAIFQQGILKLYYDNCQYQACDDCKKMALDGEQ